MYTLILIPFFVVTLTISSFADNLSTDVTTPSVPFKPSSSLNRKDVLDEKNFKTVAHLRGLNKITARTAPVKVSVDQPALFGNLTITLLRCWKSPPEDPPESIALLDIWESLPGEAPRKVFNGWMFASSPGLSTLEHPVYDIIVNGCTDPANKEP